MDARPGWQKQLYAKAKYEVEASTKYRDKYITAYERMRDSGIEQYSIDDMDVSLIVEVLYDLKDVFPAERNTIYSINKVKADRNAKGHSCENEDLEELYLQGLLNLVNLRRFVVDVDKYEVSIADEYRLDFRRKYIPLIDRLKETLDDERIESLHAAKQIDRDISKILQSKNPDATWLQVWELYMNRDWKLEKNPQGFTNFLVKASDAGIKYAHSGAMDYFLFIQKDYVEVERRMVMLLGAYAKLPIHEMKSVLDAINTYVIGGNSVTTGMVAIIERIKAQGYDIVSNDDGTYSWNK